MQDKLRNDARAIFSAGLDAVDPYHAIKTHLQREGDELRLRGRSYNLLHYENVYVVGAGKAAAPMSQAVEEILGNKLTAGIVNVKYGHTAPLRIVKINEAGHPVPDEAGLRGAREIVELLEKTGESDLVICLISGGGSALLPFPVGDITLRDKQVITKALLDSGATIHEINAIRKRISRVKGGRLAKLAHPSALISLILSDVIGDNLDVIASGPTVADTYTLKDCISIIDRYQLWDNAPSSIVQYIEKRGTSSEETPKPDDPAFIRTQNEIIASNSLAVRAAREKARSLGYNCIILSTLVHGETREIAKIHSAIVKEIILSGNPISPPACVISGGETTVTIKGGGQGGRNQEFALASAIDIDGLRDVVFLSAGTDGTDGPTDAAGAIASGSTMPRARKLSLDAHSYLNSNDSYNFFKPLGDLLITGPTNTNVMDLRLVLVNPPANGTGA